MGDVKSPPRLREFALAAAMGTMAVVVGHAVVGCGGGGGSGTPVNFRERHDAQGAYGINWSAGGNSPGSVGSTGSINGASVASGTVTVTSGGSPGQPQNVTTTQGGGCAISIPTTSNFESAKLDLVDDLGHHHVKTITRSQLLQGHR